MVTTHCVGTCLVSPKAEFAWCLGTTRSVRGFTFTLERENDHQAQTSAYFAALPIKAFGITSGDAALRNMKRAWASIKQGRHE